MGFYIYCRISRDQRGERAGVQLQEKECREFAEQRGLDILEVFTDNSISAFGKATRPAYDEMVKRLESGEADGVICYHVDRLYRRSVDLENLVNLVEKTNILIRTVHSDDLDLNTATGRFMARMIGSMASYEIEHAQERIRSSQADRAHRGKWRGGRVPFGFKTGSTPGTLEVDEEKADALRWLTAEVIAGTSLFSLSRRLNEKGVARPNGKPWTNTALRYMLKAPAMAGLSVHKGEVVGKAEWPAIIPEDTWYSMQAILNDPARRTNQGNERKWQGTGVYKCGRCGGGMRLQSNKERNKKTYVCRECNKTSRSQQPVDDLVDSLIIGYLSKPENRLQVADKKQSGGEKLSDLLEERRHLVNRDNELAVLFADGKMSSGQMLAASDQLKKRMTALDRKIDSARETSPTASLLLGGDDIAERWGKLTADKRAYVIGELLLVEILPTGSSPVFDDRSVRITWK